MKRNLVYIIVCLLLSCSTMPYTFDRIDENTLRVVGVSVSPHSEVSPGDTVTITAYFGGNKVTSLRNVSMAHVLAGDWDGVSFDDSYPLTLVKEPTGFPDSAIFSFVIKPDVFKGRNKYFGSQQNLVDSITHILTMPPDTLTSFWGKLTKKEQDSLTYLTNHMILWSHLLFTAHSENGSDLTVKTIVSIKYHIPLFAQGPLNTNPIVNWVGICKVPSVYANGFYPSNEDVKGKFVMSYLYNKNNPKLCDSIIDIDTGYAYFLAADNGITEHIDTLGNSSYDTAWVMQKDPSREQENTPYRYMWFYQNVDMVSDYNDSLMLIDNSSSSCIEMKPPYNVEMKHFKAWVTACSEFVNWPFQQAQTIRKVEGIFRYSEAYKRKMSEIK